MVSDLPCKKLELTDAMCVGHPEIDDEHRNLIEIVNDIVSARHEGNLEKCRVLILHFADSMKKHFRREEEILKEAGFPRLDEHKEHHLGIEGDVENISQDLGDNINDQKIWENFYQSLISIVVEDAIKADMDFKSFLMDMRR